MSTTTPAKTQGAQLLALRNIAANQRFVGSAQDVASKLAATVCIHLGRTSTTAFSANSGVDVYVQANRSASGDDGWHRLASWSTEAAAACSSNMLAASGNDSAGAHGDTNAITLTANSALDYSSLAGGPALAALVYIRGASGGAAAVDIGAIQSTPDIGAVQTTTLSTPAGEFHRCRYASTGSSSLYLFDDLARDQNSSALYGGAPGAEGAWEFRADVDLSAIARLRLVIHNRGTGVSVDAEAFMITEDALNTA